VSGRISGAVADGDNSIPAGDGLAKAVPAMETARAIVSTAAIIFCFIVVTSLLRHVRLS